MESLCCNADYADAETGVREGLVQVGPLVGGHSTVVAGFGVEHEVGGYDCSANDGGAVEEALAEGAGGGRVGNLGAAGGLVGAAEGGLEGMAGFGECCGSGRGEGVGG